MRFLRFSIDGTQGLAVARSEGGAFRGFLANEGGYPGDLTPEFIARVRLSDLAETLSKGREIDLGSIRHLPPIADAGKVVCVGLNYVDHSAETGFKVPEHPTVFARFTSSLIGHGDNLIAPSASEQFDYEGELAVVIGRTGRHISRENALEYVLGYSIFNDASVRDFQLRTPQWTIGKNFDGTGAFGPVLVTPDELAPGCAGMGIRTTLNGHTVQSANIDDLVFSVANLIADLSATMTLESGDVIVTGTPAGVGAGRKPPLWMKPGDICEVEIDGIGRLRNSVRAEGV